MWNVCKVNRISSDVVSCCAVPLGLQAFISASSLPLFLFRSQTYEFYQSHPCMFLVNRTRATPGVWDGPGAQEGATILGLRMVIRTAKFHSGFF